MADVFVGRTVELAEVDAQWARALSGEPRVVWVVGEAGMGKSAFLREWLRRVGDSASRIVAVADEAERELEYALLHQLGLPSEAQQDALAAGVELLQRVSAASSEGPLVIVVDDAHHADALSLRALAFTLRRLRADRVLSIFATRPGDERGPAGSLRRLAEDHDGSVELVGLGPADVVAMAEGLGHRLSAGAAARLCAHTGGNPLYLDAMCRELTSAQLQASDSLPAPRRFSLLVTTTVARLPGDAQDLARAAAVLGDSVPVSLAAHLAEVDAVRQAVDCLTASGLLRAVHTPHGWAMQWSHPLIRAAVYDDIGLAERARLHLTAAGASDGVTSLMHRVAASLGPDEELASELEAAAASALAAGRMRSSAELSIKAYRVTAAPQAAAARLLAGIDGMLACGDLAAVAPLTAALAEVPDTAAALHTRARLARLSGDHAAAVTLAKRSWALIGRQDAELRSALAEMLTHLEMVDGHLEDAVRWADAALSSPAMSSHQRSVAQASAVLSLTYQGDVREALARVVDLADDPVEVARARHPEVRARGFARMVSDDWAGSTRDLLAVAAALGTDPAPERLLALSGAAEGEYRLGDWDRSLGHAEQAVSLGEDAGQVWMLGVLHCMPVLVLAPRGQWVEAERHLRRAEEVARLVGEEGTRAYLVDAQVHLDVCRGDSSAAVQHAADPILNTLTFPRQPGVLRLPVHYASALVSLGRFEEAQESLVAFEAIARQAGRKSLICALARVRGELATARRDTTAARVAFDEAKELAGSADALERGLIHLAAGRFLRRRGERRAASQELTTAYDLLRALNAKPWADRCAEELARIGIGPRETSQADSAASWEQLTPQEQLVADLVCRGMTNHEVAAELVLSPKTVSYHLANVYTKLGVHSRTQLAAHPMVRRAPPPDAPA